MVSEIKTLFQLNWRIKNILDSEAEVEQKLDQIETWIAAKVDLLKQCLNPKRGEHLRSLAERVMLLPHDPSSSCLERMKRVAQQLIAYADGAQLPPEIVQRIVKGYAQSSPGPYSDRNLFRASKQTRQFLLEFGQNQMWYLLEQPTAEKVIQIARDYGSSMTAIDISHIPFSANQIAELLSHLPKLHTLHANSCQLKSEAAEAIVSSPNAANLRTLGLGNNQLRNAGAAHLARSPELTHLTILDLSNNWIEEEGALEIAQSCLGNLQTLIVNANKIKGIGVRDIISSDRLRSLSSIDLEGTECGCSGLREIAQAPQSAKLTRLNLRGEDLGPAGGRIIGSTTNLNNLRSLNVSSTGMGIQGVAFILRGTHLHNLHALDISHNHTQDFIVPVMNTALMAGKLKELYLSDNQIGDAGAVGIGKMTRLKNLEILDLSLNRIGDEGAIAIAVSFMPHLRRLSLSQNSIRVDGACMLIDEIFLPQLERLELDDNPIDMEEMESFLPKEDIQLLKNAFAHVKLRG